MARFVFELESLLRFRKQQERQRQRDVAVIAGEMTRLEAELRTLTQTAQTATVDLRTNHLLGKIDVAFLAAHRRYVLSVQRKSMSIAQKMTVVQKQLDEARGKLVQAARDRKILEKLREKRFASWLTEQNRREFIEADDLGTRLAFADETPLGEDAP
jgi:flagellar FliJ protein